ncbi:MAG: peroxiredoxin [Frankiales bacterium]|nr:peroxiredoxin [Frankiales bacterium]
MSAGPDIRLHAGDPAPQFSLAAADGSVVSLSDFRGGRVIVYFYPKAMTSGCTIQAHEFESQLARLRAEGASVVGISRDLPEKLAEFATTEELSFPLLSDPDSSAHRAYHVLTEQIVDDQTTVKVLRSTFVVSADGLIEQANYGVQSDAYVPAV